MSDLLQGLNPQQAQGVQCTEGPLLILAGAGSGKTRVLTHRIAYIIEQGLAYPSQILAITFTNKAAKEMKERVEKLIGTESASMWVSTFHSMCVRILRRDINKIGYHKNFIIYDTIDQKSLLQECLKELNVNEKQFPLPTVIKVISDAKDKLLTSEDLKNQNEGNYRLEKIATIYQLYQKKLRKNNALDFDDLIFKTIQLFQENSKVLQYYQNKFKYILVDEYQDTNYAQYKLVNLLAQGYKNLCVVGDDDQSIYRFRGADVRNILDFENDFPDAKTIKLEQNYRSSQRILDAANYIIQNNRGRKNKRLWTDKGEGSPISVKKNQNEYQEGDFIAQEIEKCRKEEGRSYGDFAVLYRTNAQSRVLEESFMREGIPYQIFGGQKFYSRMEIKDILAYLTLLENPYDDIALKRIINVPKRGIGKTTLEKIENYAEFKDEGMYSIILDIDEVPGLSKNIKNKVKKFSTMMTTFMAMKEVMGLTQLIQYVLENSGYLEMLNDGKIEKAEIRLENLEEFISAAMEFEENSEDTTLQAFLENISLVADVDNLEEGEGAVVLMTLHNAKGLEFPVVFLAGMEEGMFPHFRSLTDYEEMEEERRLCYVGITRAMQKLYMTYANQRTIYGQTTYYTKSRFLEEIPSDLLIEEEECGVEMEENSLFQGNFGIGKGKNTDVRKSVSQMAVTTSSKETLNNKEIQVGMKVKHKKFGIGTIVERKEQDGDIIVSIAFPGLGIKKLSLSFAPLTIVE
ncbi:DNA helicase PcrA [Garciella nitratireducens]|uniref:ATP-dependent DNA helicase n=1 Tax=Garciella nitratireducens DSM 15102 TaxID=1121911 RepID=A0A1T4NCC1_9FIRM|nr:DNA helicase PcrA [Garciella nitratireducens]SJZ76753.1 ATP-dependent DNA helicase PcrA [Garciella nitratireducens DSM 15102]